MSAKYSLFLNLVLTQDFIPEDWGTSDVWQDNSYCVEDQDNFLVFEASETKEGVLATREGCFNWCKDQYEFLEANCCSQAFFGTQDDSYFIAYCALYYTDQDVVQNEMTDEDGTITAFASTMMIFDQEEAPLEIEQVIDPGIDINLFPGFYDQAFDGV